MPNETPTWDDTIDAPSWEDTTPIDSQFKRDELAKQTFEAQIEGERAKLGTALATAGGNAAYWVADALAKVDPTGVSANILARQGVQRTPPILTPEDIDTATEVVKKGLHIPETAPAEGKLGEVTRGLAEAGKEMAVGFSDPGMISGLGLAKKLPQEGARLFQLQMMGALPSTVEHALESKNLEEAVKSGVGVSANVAFPIMLGGAAVGPSVRVPDFIGRQLEMQRGAIPPRGEPVAPIERVTPEQSAVAAERMSAPFEGKLPSEPSILAPEKTEVPLDVKPLEVAPEKTDVAQTVPEPAKPEVGATAIPDAKQKMDAVGRFAANHSKAAYDAMGFDNVLSWDLAREHAKDEGLKLKATFEIDAKYDNPAAEILAIIEEAKAEKFNLVDLAKKPEPTPKPAETPVEAAGKVKPFEVDDQLIMRSPHTGDDTIVSFRGLLPNGQAVVWTGRSQFPVPVEWLRRTGETYEQKPPIVSGTEERPNANLGGRGGESENYLPTSVGQPSGLQSDIGPSGGVSRQGQRSEQGIESTRKINPPAGVEQLSRLSKDQLFEIYRKEVPLTSDVLKSAFQKRTIKSIVAEIEGARANAVRQKSELELTQRIFPEIMGMADAAGSSWRTALNKYASDRGWSFHPPAETTKGEYAAMLALEQARQNLKNQPAQPIPQGPGARTAQTIEAPESYSGTALKNAVAEVERAGLGMREAPEHIRQAISEAWIRAGRTLERDPMAGQKLVDELAADPKGRGLTFDESALLLRQKVILSNEMNAAAEGIHTAKTPLDKARAEANFDWAHEKMLTMLDAIKNRGTAWGQEGRWRQVMAREDFSLATLITQREAALGKKILPGTPEFEELKKHADRLQELNKQLEDRVAQVQAEFEASEVKRAMAEAQANANKELPYHPRILELAEGYAKKWDARGAKALADLKEMFGEGQAFSGAPISPAMLDKAIIYGTSKMVRGAVDIAKWTDSMVKDLGEGFRKYAKDVFDASKRAFDQDVKTDFKKPEVERRVKGALKADLGTETILKQISSKAAKTKEGRLPNINYYLRKLGRVYAREGIKEEGPFLDRMTADVQKVIPNLTRDDVRAIFGGYAEEVRALSKEPVEAILRDMRGQSQELHKLSLLKQKIIPPKLQERATPSEKQRQLRKQVEAEKRTGGFAPPDPEVQLRSAMQSAETRLINQITDLTREIDSGEKLVKQQRAPLRSEKLDALRARRDALREIHDEVFKKPDLTDAERLEIWKERVREQIDELRDRRRRGDFKPKPKPDPIRFDKQAIELQFLKEVEHRALMEMRAKDELSKRTTPEVIKDSLKNAAMFAHMAMAGGEFSAVFKQGATGAYSMPIRTARNFAKSLEAWWSDENQFKIKHEILTRDNAPRYRRDKLEFTDVGGRLSSMEEMYMFRVMDWMKKVPGLSHYVRYMDRFQRAFSTFLNLMRADTYDAMVKEMGSSPEAGQSAANYINVATGRGSHSTARFGGSGANAIFFAPRWSISRFQYLLGQPILAAKPGYKKYIVKQYAKTLAGLGSVYALGYAMGGDVDWNPTSSKFGKIQIGNRVIDPLFGLAPVMRIIAQQVTGLRKNYKGQIRPIREGGKLPIFESQIQGSRKLGPYDPSGAELMGKFAWSKLAPAPEATVSAATGENVIGEKFSIPQKVLQAITPITYKDIISAIRSEGIDEKTAIDLMSIFGLGSYVEKPKTSKPNF